jgi:sporulation protein YlmC with PRC-barrel domain
LRSRDFLSNETNLCSILKIYIKTIAYGRTTVGILEVNVMKKFITELRGKTVMTKDGKILGMIENFVVDTSSGQLHHVLVVPAEEVEPRLYPTDSQGRLVLPFTSMKAVRDVVVMDIG